MESIPPEPSAPLVPIDPAPVSPEMKNGNGAHPSDQPNALKVGALIEIGLCVFRITNINLKKKSMTLKLAGYVKQEPMEMPTPEQMQQMIAEMQAKGIQVPNMPMPVEPSILSPEGASKEALKKVLESDNLGLKSSAKRVILPHNFKRDNAGE